MTRRVTPGIRIEWSTFAEWRDALHKIGARAHNRASAGAAIAHLSALPPALIKACTDENALADVLATLKDPGGICPRPVRGKRAGAPHTRLIVEIANQIARLNAARGGDQSDPSRLSGKTHREGS